MLQSGDTVPNFTRQSTQGQIDFYDWAGDSWIVFSFYPADCTTELSNVAKLQPEFDKRSVKVIALSRNDREYRDSNDNIDLTQNTTVNCPIVADVDKSVSELYGIEMNDANGEAIVKTVFVIDPQKKLRLTIAYPSISGKDQQSSSQGDFQDVLRVIDSLQSTDN